VLDVLKVYVCPGDHALKYGEDSLNEFTSRACSFGNVHHVIKIQEDAQEYDTT
jgi:hypothetical protein